MKSASILFLKNSILLELQQVRQHTWDLLDEIDESLFFIQAHPNFSPIGWHFGHIAYTEAYWILENLAQFPPTLVQYHRLFAADGLPKKERQNLPSRSIIKNYLTTVRTRVIEYLESSSILEQERLWRWLVQHESQHCETISFLWKLHQQHKNQNFQLSRLTLSGQDSSWEEMVKVEQGDFIMGSNEINALDNESPAHKVYLDTYWIDRFPVTCGQYYQFIEAGGYDQRQYWSDAGWQWLQNHPVSHPLYWSNLEDWLNHPVCGINYYEAEAYAKFVNKRLPTEAEWEKISYWRIC